ncbi:hypothetical protein [Streptomyces sp.]|uniref:hypothetical protein n=1 Tax=Streptomyces sp. TaxID=1931 RepID=UPI002F91ED2B
MTLDICVMTHAKDPDRPRQAVDGLYLCHGHREQLRRLVAEMPARADDLDRAAGVGGGRGDGTHGGIAIDDAAATHRQHMAGVLASWCRLVAEDRGITPPTGPELSRTAPWLLTHVDWCAAHRWVDEMLTELRQVTGQAMGIADIPARRVPLGEQCLTHTGGERCEGEVTIVVRGDDWTAVCTVCDEKQEATPYLRAVQAGRWINTEGVITLARMVGIAASNDVVRQWHHRRRIKGRDDGRQKLYELGSVQAYLALRQAERERMSA